MDMDMVVATEEVMDQMEEDIEEGMEEGLKDMAADGMVVMEDVDRTKDNGRVDEAVVDVEAAAVAVSEFCLSYIKKLHR